MRCQALAFAEKSLLQHCPGICRLRRQSTDGIPFEQALWS
jgi:hypothetical protein